MPDWIHVLIAGVVGILFALLLSLLGMATAFIILGSLFVVVLALFILLNTTKRGGLGTFAAWLFLIVWGTPFFLTATITLVIMFGIGRVVV